MKKLGILTLIFSFILAGCSGDFFDFSDFGSNSLRSCSKYNGELDRFQISMDTKSAFGQIGESITPEYRASWVDNNLVRQTLNCGIDWKADTAGIIQIDPENPKNINFIGAGFTVVNGTISGNGGTKHVSFEVAVFPRNTEEEPNNGAVFADDLGSKKVFFGHLYQDDKDYFKFTVPAGDGFQVNLSSGLAGLDTSTHFRNWSDKIRGRIEFCDPNDGSNTWQYGQAVQNSTPDDWNLCAVVEDTWSYNANFPYFYKIELFESSP